MKIQEFKERSNKYKAHFSDLVLLGRGGLGDAYDSALGEVI